MKEPVECEALRLHSRKPVNDFNELPPKGKHAPQTTTISKKEDKFLNLATPTPIEVMREELRRRNFHPLVLNFLTPQQLTKAYEDEFRHKSSSMYTPFSDHRSIFFKSYIPSDFDGMEIANETTLQEEKRQMQISEPEIKLDKSAQDFIFQETIQPELQETEIPLPIDIENYASRFSPFFFN